MLSGTKTAGHHARAPTFESGQHGKAGHSAPRAEERGLISRWCRANSQTSVGGTLTHNPGGTPLGQVLHGKLGNSQKEIGKGRDLALQLGPFFIGDDDGGWAAMLGDRRRFTLLRSLDDG